MNRPTETTKHTWVYGFTIVELLVVIVVIGILASVTIVAFSTVRTKAVEASITSDLVTNSKKLKEYHVINGTFPSSAYNSGVNCGVPPGEVTASGIYCPIASNGAFFAEGYARQNNGQSFRFVIGKGSTGYAITETGQITKESCTVTTEAPPYPNYSAVYSCPNGGAYSQ